MKTIYDMLFLRTSLSILPAQHTKEYRNKRVIEWGKMSCFYSP